MIDIHAHILPGLDDGARSLRESINILKMAENQGVRTIIATPHTMDGVYQCRRDQILDACARLSMEIEKRNMAITLQPGAEVRLTHDTLAQYKKGSLLPLGHSGRYMLLELPPIFIADGVARIIRQLKNKGLTAIIAHPERNASVIKHMNILMPLLNEGALLQITSSSLLGDFGKRSRQICEILLEKQAASFIASDIHPGRRYGMRDAWQRVASIAGTTAARSIFTETPQCLISMEEQGLEYAR